MGLVRLWDGKGVRDGRVSSHGNPREGSRWEEKAGRCRCGAQFLGSMSEEGKEGTPVQEAVEEVGDPGPEEEADVPVQDAGEEVPALKAGNWIVGKPSKRGQFDGVKARILQVRAHKFLVSLYGTREERWMMRSMCSGIPEVDEEEEEKQYQQEKADRAKAEEEEEETEEEVTKGAGAATRARKGTKVVAAGAATRARKVAPVVAARAPRKRKRPDQAEVGTPLGAVIKLLPTDGLVGLGTEVMQELAIRIRGVED
jgi:hypothetical protein